MATIAESIIAANKKPTKPVTSNRNTAERKEEAKLAKAAKEAAKEAAKAEKAAALKAAADQIPSLPEKAKVIKTEADILRTSTAVKPTKLVWLIASKNPNASRKDVITLCEQMGIATNTAKTQYQAWFAANKAQA